MLIQKYALLPVVILTSLSVLTACTAESRRSSAENLSMTDTVTENTTGVDTSTSLKKIATYQTPSGSVVTTFSIDLATDGTIQSISASTDSRDHEDAQYARRFSSSATKSLVGKKLSDLTSLSAIGGASLTTDAFVSVIQS